MNEGNRKEMAKKMNLLDYIAIILIIVGAINWGLFGAFSFNLVEFLFGMGAFTSFIYVVVGISGLYSAFRLITN